MGDPTFDEEEIEDLRSLIQLLRDYRAWGRFSKYIVATIKWTAGFSAGAILFKEPLMKILGLGE